LNEKIEVRESLVLPGAMPVGKNNIINSEDDHFAHIDIELEVPHNMDQKGLLSVHT
jgi:hypothetical protein